MSINIMKVSYMKSNNMSWCITEFVTRVTRSMSHMGQELFTPPDHLISPPVFGEVCVVLSSVFCVVFCRLLFVFFVFCGFWLSLCYLQAF